MISIPRAYRNVGMIQFFLASAFVIWLLFFPDTGALFAWPVVPRLTAMFLGTSFILRAFIGLKMWREPDWYRLRWIPFGSYSFLALIFVGTLWHIGEMNWKTNIIMAHIWVIAYVTEPVMLAFVEPRVAGSDVVIPPDQAAGPLMPGLQRVLIAGVMLSVTIAGLAFINPAFLNTRWPWPIDEFDGRIMAAFPAGCALWAGRMYFARDWSEIRLGMQGLVLYTGALFVVWLVNVVEGQFDPTRLNIWTYGIIVGLAAASLGYYYWRQERVPAAMKAKAPAAVR